MTFDPRFQTPPLATLAWRAHREQCRVCVHQRKGNPNHSRYVTGKGTNGPQGVYCAATPSESKWNAAVYCIDARGDKMSCGPYDTLFEARKP